jgi:hypothetical protein
MVVKYQGQRAHIRFHDGMTYAIPAAPLMQIGVAEGGTFVLVTTWVGRVPVDSRVELLSEARPSLGRRAGTPKILVRDGRKMITRQPARGPSTTPR